MRIFCASSVMGVMGVVSGMSVMRVMSFNVYTYECYLWYGCCGYYEQCENKLY